MGTRRTRALLLRCALLASSAAGCTSSGSEDAGAELGTAPGPSAGSLALVRLERFAPDEAEPARVVANAKVARYSGLEASAVLKLLGADVRDAETCTIESRLDDLVMTPDARVELLSVGEIALRAGELAQKLSPRLFPDLAPNASGWFYGMKAELPAQPSEPDEYALSAQGEQGIGRFELAVAAPSGLTGLEVAGEQLEPGRALSRGADLELRWEPEDMRDRIEVDIVAGGSVLACSLRDDGQFVLNHGKLANLEPDQHASLVLRRVRVISSEMQGIESAYVRIASTRTVPIRVEQ